MALAIPRNTLKSKDWTAVRKDCTVVETLTKKQIFFGARPKRVTLLVETPTTTFVPYGYARNKWPDHPVPLGARIDATWCDGYELRADQQQYLKELTDALEENGSVLLHLPTGVGKTMTAVGGICHWRRVALVVSQPKDQDQWIITLSRTTLVVHLVSGRKAIPEDVDVYLCSIGCLPKLSPAIKKRIGTVIIDEVDALCTPRLVNLLFPVRYVVGLTATAQRRNGMHALMKLLLGDAIVYRPSTAELSVIRWHTGIVPDVAPGAQWADYLRAVGSDKQRMNQAISIVKATFPHRYLFVCWLEDEVLALAQAFLAADVPCSTYYGSAETYEDAPVVITTIAKGGRGFDEATKCRKYGGQPFSVLALWSTTKEQISLLPQIIGRLRLTYRTMLEFLDLSSVSRSHARERDIHYADAKALIYEFMDHAKGLKSIARILTESGKKNGFSEEYCSVTESEEQSDTLPLEQDVQE